MVPTKINKYIDDTEFHNELTDLLELQNTLQHNPLQIQIYM